MCSHVVHTITFVQPEAPCGVVSHTFLTSAIKGVHQRKACIFGKSSSAVCVDQLAATASACIRMALSKYRDLQTDDVVKSRVYARAALSV